MCGHIEFEKSFKESKAVGGCKLLRATGVFSCRAKGGMPSACTGTAAVIILKVAHERKAPCDRAHMGFLGFFCLFFF